MRRHAFSPMTGLAAVLLLAAGPSLAQIATDGSVGPAQALVGPDYEIPASLGSQVGGNLFHSFGEFHLRTDAGVTESATFTPEGSAGPIDHVLSRVTGGGASQIDGRLRSTIPGAQLYLFNPSGVVFGPNAELDLQGPFHVSTSDFVRLGAEGIFHAADPGLSVLAVAAPSSFGFAREAPAAVAVAGSLLEVAPGESFAVVGGDVSLENGNLRAPGGELAVVSVAAPGEVAVGAGGSPELAPGAFSALGRVELVQTAPPRSDPAGNRLGNLDASADAAGRISIRAGRLVMGDFTSIETNTGASDGGGIDVRVSEEVAIASTDRGQFFEDGFYVRARGAGDGGELSIAAPVLRNDGGVLQAQTFGAGDAGALRIAVGRLELTGDGLVDGGTDGPGRGGEVMVEASESVFIQGGGVLSDSSPSGGDAGDLRVVTPSLELTGGARLDTASQGGAGNAGALRVEAERVVLANGARMTSSTSGSGRGGELRLIASESAILLDATLESDSFGAGEGGLLRVETPSLQLQGPRAAILADSFAAGNATGIELQVGSLLLLDGAQVATGARSSGRGGALRVEASESVAIGPPSPGGTLSGLFANSFFGASGGGGDLSVTAPLIDVLGGAIQASTASDASAGVLRLTGDRILLRGGASVETSSFGGAGDAGQIELAGGTLEMDAARVVSTTEGVGSAGDVGVEVAELHMVDGARIESGSSLGSQGQGGSVAIRASESIEIRDDGSAILLSSNGTGDAGSLSLASPVLEMSQSASLQADSLFAGRAGAVSIDVGRLELASGAQITSSSLSTDRGGDVGIRAQDLVAIGGRDALGIPSGVFVIAADMGDAGSLTLSADELRLEDGNIQTSTLADGAGGAIEITVVRLALAEGAEIASFTRGAGRGGAVALRATESISIAGRNAGGGRSRVSVATEGPGDAGSLLVATPDLEIRDGRLLADTLGTGSAGRIEVDVARLSLSEGAQISSGTRGPGPGSTLDVSASDFATIRGSNRDAAPSGLFVASTGSGAAGTVLLDVGDLSLADGAIVSSQTFADGPAGDVEVSAGRRLAISGAGTSGPPTGILSSSEGSQRGGDIRLRAPAILISDAGLVSAESGAEGDAGDISISGAGRVELASGGSITTEARQADGGNVSIAATKLVSLFDSRITATVRGGQGNGGNITIDPRFVVLASSDVIANAFGGAGGNIQIVAGNLFASPDAVIQASSELGIQGNVEIDAPEVDIAGTILALPGEFLDAAALLGQVCGREQDVRGSLVIWSRDGMPPAPDQSLPAASAEGSAPGWERSEQLPPQPLRLAAHCAP